MTVSLEAIPGLAAASERHTAEQVLEFAFSHFGQTAALACSFGAEDVVLADMAARLYPGARVFYLDTGFLFPETHAVRERISARYSLRLEVCRPALSPAEQDAQLGEALWSRQPDKCCELRKVEPLRKQLGGLSAWITGIRRDQAPKRAHARKIEWDAKFNLVKFNPLADWTWERVWQYIRAHNVPYNDLHDRHYPSIGCTHCTRPVLPNEDPRAGRWSGFQKTECGLHK